MRPILDPTRKEYLRELWPYLRTVSLLLALAIIAGALLANHSAFARLKVGESLGGFAQVFLGLPKPLLALLIFANNAVKTFLVVVLGTAFAIMPVAFIIVNGAALGFVLHLATQARGFASSLLAIVPHGVFELPAILLGAGIGMMLGVKVTRRLFRGVPFQLRYELGRAVKFFATTILPLLLIAALVEAYLTATLMGK